MASGVPSGSVWGVSGTVFGASCGIREASEAIGARLGGVLQVVLALWSRLETVWNYEAPILDPWTGFRRAKLLKILWFFYDFQDFSFLRPGGSKRAQDVPKTAVDGPKRASKGSQNGSLRVP